MWLLPCPPGEDKSHDEGAEDSGWASVTLSVAVSSGERRLPVGRRLLSGKPDWHRGMPDAYLTPGLLHAEMPRDEQRVLKLVATDVVAFERLIDGLQADAIASRLRRIAVRCQTAMSVAYTHLTGRGFRVHWTDLRMTLPEAPEPEVDGVLMSNWEI